MGMVKPVLSGVKGARLREKPFWRRGAESQDKLMRTYLVVMDETEEALAALRYAARRAARTGGGVEILALIEQPEFVQWGAVQDAMEEEARLRAEAMLVQASGAIMEEAGIKPSITVRQGDRIKAVAELLTERDDIAALVLAAAAEGGPGPLISHFAGPAAASLPCPLVIVPAGLGEDKLTALS
jgi:nucleotide-binding universal stress UspA family protein